MNNKNIWTDFQEGDLILRKGFFRGACRIGAWVNNDHIEIEPICEADGFVYSIDVDALHECWIHAPKDVLELYRLLYE